MLKKINRLKNTRFKSKESFSTPYFTLKITKNQLVFSRFGFVVSKSVDKRAVVRNRIKRQVRSFVENNLSKIEQGNDILFILKKELIGLSTKKIGEVLEKDLKSKKIIL